MMGWISPSPTSHFVPPVVTRCDISRHLHYTPRSFPFVIDILDGCRLTTTFRLKGSLLGDNDDPISEAPADGGRASGAGAGRGSVTRTSEGARGRQGLWEEAGKGEMDLISAALAPGGCGDVHACQVDGKRD